MVKINDLKFGNKEGKTVHIKHAEISSKVPEGEEMPSQEALVRFQKYLEKEKMCKFDLASVVGANFDGVTAKDFEIGARFGPKS